MHTRSALGAFAIAAMLVTGCGGNAAQTAAPSVSRGALAALSPTADPLAAVRADLAPTGKLRVGIFGPPFVGSKDANGQIQGVAVAVAQQLGAKLGTEVVVGIYESPDDALKAQGTWDVLFIPSNASPGVAAALAYTAPLLLIPHTFLVSDPSIRTAKDLDRPTIRIATEASHAGQVHAQLPTANIVTLENPESLAQLKAGKVDAFATGRFALQDALKELPAGYHILDGTFFTATLAIGVGKGRTGGLAWLSGFIEAQKSSGAIQKIVDATGKQGLEIPASAY